MQGANKTINTKVGLDLPMSEQVRQRLVTLNEGKTHVKSSTTSRALPPISFTAYPAVDVACFTLEKLEDN